MLRPISAFTTSALVLVLFATLNVSATFGQSRWGQTATNGSGLSLGDATTITWGFVSDGTAITPALSSESTDASDLIGFLDTNIGAGAGGTDLTNRPWFTVFDSIFERWGNVSGLSFSYEANDSGERIDNTVAPRGQLGVVADVRISGHSIDGQTGGNTLAYNYFPDHGDMVIDTDNVSFYSNSSNNYLGLRNVLAHEFGHGMGLPHVTANNSRQLMEGSINTTFDGPQIDDIHQAQRRYGDNWEGNGGNDAFSVATDLGIFDGTDMLIGADANMGASVVEVDPDQVDFISIDNDTDVDFLQITLDSIYDMSFALDMVGPTYNHDGDSSYSLANQSDLDMVLLASDGTTVLADSNNAGIGVSEQIDMVLEAGTYYVQILGNTDATQFYQFGASGFSAVPEPGSVLALGALGALLVGRRRRRVR
ncbi:MAG: matrixin family metalloprotease [Planctomycetaceae bacterium]|nr:matrixin family metalloprotease [Planctomycetaceae bacterium]MCP4480874.1 matrixin family metalloprotease [Planctomycetaceae bacterium]MCP4775580.1 matrixin family metalloprotease [Planctomycetaceae bacterium]